MRKMRLFIPLTILFISITNASFGQNEILGHWLNEEKDAIIEISNDGGIFNGRIVWLATCCGLAAVGVEPRQV